MEIQIIQQFNLVLNCIREISAFDGTSQNQLPDFLAQVENLLPSFGLFDEGNRGILFGYLKNKCIGKTREAIHRYGIVTTWEELKGILVNNFGEKETSRELMDRLKTWKLDSTIERYHYDINNIRNKLHNRRLTHGGEGFSTEDIDRISLEVFKDHLPELTKIMIFARNPTTLEAAFRIILEARHQNYTAFGAKQKNDNTRPPYRTKFSDNERNRSPNQGNKPHHSGNNYNQRNYQNSGNSRRQPIRPGDPNNPNRNFNEPMDIGNSNVNFHGGDRNNFPI